MMCDTVITWAKAYEKEDDTDDGGVVLCCGVSGSDHS